MEDKKFYSIEEFAPLIHYSERQVRQWCIDGKIIASKIGTGRKWLIAAGELRKYTEYGERQVCKDQKFLSSPQITKSKDKHWEELVNIAERLKGELSIPGLHWYWLPTLCVCDESDTSLSEWFEKYGSLLTGWSTSEPIISDTDPLVFHTLLTHLQAESPEFRLNTLVEWKAKTHQVILASTKYSSRAFMQCVEKLGFDRDEVFPDDVKEILKGELELGIADIIPLSVMVPHVWLKYWQKCEAEGDQDPRLSWVGFWSNQQLGHPFQSEQGKTLKDSIDNINKEVQPVKDLLALVIHRRTFEGTCSICESWGI